MMGVAKISEIMGVYFQFIKNIPSIKTGRVRIAAQNVLIFSVLASLSLMLSVPSLLTSLFISKLYPAERITCCKMVGVTFLGLKFTHAVWFARLTPASSTPSTLLSMLSTLAEQPAHDIPVTG